MTQPDADHPLDHDLDALIDADATVAPRTGRHGGVDAASGRAVALHRLLREPPDTGATPNLAPIVMERIARRLAAPPVAATPRASLIDRLRSALASLALGPVVAAGSLAAVLTIALLGGRANGGGTLSGAAVGVAVPSLAIVAVSLLAIGALAWWLRRR